MSATPPPALEGSQSPSQIEFLWERYRALIWTVVGAVACALLLTSGLKYFEQRKVDAAWSAFASTLRLDEAYTDIESQQSRIGESPASRLADVELASLEQALSSATDAQRPYLYLAIARRALLDRQWDRAEKALGELESKYPNHSLVKTSEFPIQVRDIVKRDPKAEPARREKPELKPQKTGSVVALIRAQIEAGRAYETPAQFAKVEVPADATRVKFELSGGYGSFVIALMPQAPKHAEAFLELAKAGHWKDFAVDEVRRSTKQQNQARAIHIGFESTKDDDSTKWNQTDPSKHLLDFESNSLSHFAGAVSARNEAPGKDGQSKSCADRFWIVGDDAPQHDGERVVFGFVVEGLENVQRVAEASLSVQDEDLGRGKPTENIRVTQVTVL